MSDWTMAKFNDAPAGDGLPTALNACCAAGSWVARIAGGRPYADEAALYSASDAATAELDEMGLAEALAGHPRIGERADHAGVWSTQEQARVADAAGDMRIQLAAANAEYEEKFGHVYLVCATGRSAEELLGRCRARLDNDATVERAVVLDELAKINRLRLGKLLRTERR